MERKFSWEEKKRLYFPGVGSKQISQKRARVTTWATNLSGEENCLFLEDVSKHIHLKIIDLYGYILKLT